MTYYVQLAMLFSMGVVIGWAAFKVGRAIRDVWLFVKRIHKEQKAKEAGFVSEDRAELQEAA